MQVRVRVTPSTAWIRAHQPAELIQAGRLHPGHDVVGTARSSAHCTPSRALTARAGPARPTSVWTSTYALSIPRASSALPHHLFCLVERQVGRAIAPAIALDGLYAGQPAKPLAG
jgi:hypothetical protein